MATKQLSAKQVKASKLRVFVVATNSEYAKLCDSSLKRLPSGSNVELLSFPTMDQVSLSRIQSQSALLISRLSDISQGVIKSTSIGADAKQVLFMEGLPVEAVASRLLRLNIRSPARLHLAAERDSESMKDLVRRLVSGMTHGDGRRTIADAWIEGEQLVLLSPSFIRLNIPLEKMARFIGKDKSKVCKFEIDEDGRFLYWPHADAHFGWTQFRQIVDPASAIADIKKTEQFNKRYGAAIRSLRESTGLKQGEIQGITDRQLRRVEHGEQAVSSATLAALACAHSLPLNDYMEKLAKAIH